MIWVNSSKKMSQDIKYVLKLLLNPKNTLKIEKIKFRFFPNLEISLCAVETVKFFFIQELFSNYSRPLQRCIGTFWAILRLQNTLFYPYEHLLKCKNVRFPSVNHQTEAGFGIRRSSLYEKRPSRAGLIP